MAYKSDAYQPNAKSDAILARAWEQIQSVPYAVTARWLFYRLLQEGFYQGKKDYKDCFLPLLSRARHNFYGPWRPDTLADDRREASVRGDGWDSPAAWAAAVARGGACRLARWAGQAYYVELWFEAGAMVSQFEHYTANITLRPFFGMPSIPYKWEIAKALEAAAAAYALPVVILYFGDLDPAGEIIPETTVADIRGWCSADFEFIRAGLNPGDEVRYNIPENIEHAGAYQWEALADGPAGELITSAVGRYVDFSAMTEIAEREAAATANFRSVMADLAQAWQSGL
jgi:hypothetical protein